MLDNFLAEKFIDRVKETTDYNINIMNKKGIIIASKDKERIGDFHEVAYWIIQGDEEIIDVPEDDSGRYMGVKPGVMLPIVQNGERIGAIGVTGEPREVHQIGKVMRFAVETMYEYELQHEQKARRNSIKERFLYSVLYDKEVDEEKLQEDAASLGWDEDCVRIPVYLSLDEMADLPTVLRKLRESRYYRRQDISSVVREKDVIVFKSFDNKAGDLAGYREMIEEYVESCTAYLNMMGSVYHICVGTFQNYFRTYGAAYRHCMWILENGKGRIRFFYDYQDDYLKSRIPLDEYEHIYAVYDSMLKGKSREDFMSIIGSLKSSNYNFNSSSKELYVHKNTLVFRFNKIRDLLHKNPVQFSGDRMFLENLHFYLKSKK